tara:strand:- start:227 stop:1456 length:1230 start_codon:yes stop_codon:yes gene_type:complete
MRSLKFFGALSLILLAAQCAPASNTRTASETIASKYHTLTEQEVVDLLVGSCIQATRGCGTGNSILRVKEAIAKGATFNMISPEDLPDDWMTISPAIIGGGGAWEYVIERTNEQGIELVENTNVKAVQLLADHIDTDFNAVVRAESAGAMVTALLLSSELGMPIVDACLSVRARPEVQQQIPWLKGIPTTPVALFTRWGDEVIIQKGIDDYRAEDLARGVAVSSGGGAAIAMNPMTGAQVKHGTVPGALSDAIRLGRTVREAREQERDPIEALIEVTDGYKLFQGIVTKSDQHGDRGFSWTDVELTGVGEFEGQKYQVFVKNENIVSWLDGQIDVTSPDYIYNLNPETGEAVTGGGLGGYPLGDEVVMVGVAGHPLWLTPEGIEVIGPRHFGFDFDYTPIAELQKRRSD